MRLSEVTDHPAVGRSGGSAVNDPMSLSSDLPVGPAAGVMRDAQEFCPINPDLKPKLNKARTPCHYDPNYRFSAAW